MNLKTFLANLEDSYFKNFLCTSVDTLNFTLYI